MEEMKYQPLSYSQFVELKNELDKISNNVPESVAPLLWNYYNLIRAKSENRPCMCQSAAALWIGCVNFLREWVSTKLN